MDSISKLYTKKAQNEINLSKIILKISQDESLQEKVFSTPKDTYFSAVITHAYFSIFYMAKAYLLKKGIKTDSPEEHKKTYETFKQLVEEGIVDVELLKLYEEALIRADTLVSIFHLEKSKCGKFTYKELPQANQEPAEKSIKNAEQFFKHVH